MQRIIGQTQHGDIVIAELENSKIKSIGAGNLVHSDQTYDGNTYLTKHSWGGEYTVNGIVYKSGVEIPEDFTPVINDEAVKQIIDDEDYYEAEGHYCEECGTFHDTDQYYDLSYTVTEYGGFYCKSCVPAEELLVEVNEGEDIFRSKDMTGVDVPENYEEVETLFCDSSGFGSSSEPALTKEQAIDKTRELIEKFGELYSGLTGIGQFQVYVTLYKKVG
jgi:hypothetical protein